MILHLQGRENLISWLCAPSFLAICYRLRTQSSTISSAPVHEESYHCAFINEEPPRAPESTIIEGFSKVFIPFGHWFWGQMVSLTIMFTKCNIYFDILYKLSENYIEISESQPLLQPLKQSEAKVKIYTPTDYWFCFTASLILVLLGKDCEKSIFLKLFVLKDFYFLFCTFILPRSIKLCKSNP